MKELSKIEKGFMIASTKERMLLTDFWKNQNQDFLIKKISKVESKDRYDAVITSGETDYLVEIKTRRLKRTTYPDSMIEKSKFDYLVDTCIDSNVIPSYWVFYLDGSVCIWNLNKTVPVWKKKLNPKQTVGNRTKVEKTIGNLPFSEATIYQIDLTNKNYTTSACAFLEVMFPNNIFN